MKKNVSGQSIGCQMVSASDGAAFTDPVTVYITIDNGTQTIGSVGSGVCTHEGNGYHSYAPSQAETNGDHIAFTFIGTAAIPATMQVYPSFPQSGDCFSRLGAPAGASVSADVAAVKTQTGGIETDTQDIQARLPAALVSGRMDASVGAMESNVMTAAAAAADFSQEIRAEIDANSTQLAAIKAKTDNLPSDPADESSIQSSLATIAGYIDTEISAIKAKTDQLTFTTANQVDATTVANSDKSGYSLASDFRIKKNTALANFMFVMLDSADHVSPKTGLTITPERSLDGAAFAACANAAAEISAGVYKIDLAAVDLNGDVVTLKFTASGADPRLVTIVTQTE